MTIEIDRPEDEAFIQKRLQSGAFRSVGEVIHHALQAQDAGESCLELHKREVGEQLERAMAEFDEGGGIPASEVRYRLQEMKRSRLAEGR